jgi:hypothetical protein
MNIGVLVDETKMMLMRTVGSLTTENASLVLDLRYKNLLVYFELHLLSSRRPQEYRLKIHFSQLDRFFESKDPRQVTFPTSPSLALHLNITVEFKPLRTHSVTKRLHGENGILGTGKLISFTTRLSWLIFPWAYEG